ncbi:PTS sugar transporter subunit IIA [Congregibacter brevis]|uniref:PTS sugar transporter subunit IIA n=1 Tax=Congregibacter brevis TaxID=3081201 RepID=A0ABZ0IFU2_9GAMM|nr:PTS sugar transporter subunit IIA [Congregibacter sp. IMCC45268]
MSQDLSHAANIVSDLLTPSRSLCQIPGGGKKRLFELVADVLGSEKDEFHPDELVAGMLAREKLGSTALGNGIAIPHCRLNDCETPCGVLLTLSSSGDFDAPDDDEVDLIFALVVPSEATQEHLNLLADLARLFSQPDFCDALRGCTSNESLFETASNWNSGSR